MPFFAFDTSTSLWVRKWLESLWIWLVWARLGPRLGNWVLVSLRTHSMPFWTRWTSSTDPWEHAIFWRATLISQWCPSLFSANTDSFFFACDSWKCCTKTIFEFQQGLRVLRFMNNAIWKSLNNHRFYTQKKLQVGPPAMRSKRYVFFYAWWSSLKMDPSIPKPSQDSPKIAPAWPKMAPSCTQVAPKRTIWLHKGCARAIFACQQGMRFLCSVNRAIWTSYNNHWLYNKHCN